MNETKSPYSYIDADLDGIYHVPVKSDGSIYLAPIRLADIFRVVGKGVGDDGQNYHIIEYGDHEYCAIARGDVGTQEGWRHLRNMINIPSQRRRLDLLTDYIQTAGSENQEDWKITNVAGWHDDAYILPSGEMIGTTGARIYCQTKIDPAMRRAYTSSGSVEEWILHIGRYVAGNSRFCLALGAAFAAPLLRSLNVDGGVLHLYGQSTGGKSTAQRIALSVWGHGKDSGNGWNTTAYALVNNAAARNDGLLAIDEMGEDANGKGVDHSIYTLANGKGRAQGAKDGGNRTEIRFRVLAISNGEVSLEGHMSKHGREAMAGQMVRCPSIPHLLETHHDFDDFRSFTQHLLDSANSYYGSVGREFIRRLLQDRPATENSLQERFGIHLTTLIESCRLSDQAVRTARLFAVTMTGLELACNWNLTGFAAEDALVGIKRCFVDWHQSLPDKMPLEDAKIIKQAKDYIQTSDLFFLNPKQPPSVVSLPFPGYVCRSGFADEDDLYYVFPKAFTEHVARGHDENKVKEVLHGLGWLQKDKDDRWQTQLYGIEHPGGKTKRLGRFYVFKGITPPGDV